MPGRGGRLIRKCPEGRKTAEGQAGPAPEQEYFSVYQGSGEETQPGIRERKCLF